MNDRRLDTMEWEAFSQLAIGEKAALFMKEGRPYHVLSAQQFDREQLDRMGELATRIRSLAKGKTGMQFLQGLLNHKRAMLYFTQPSTRTFLSFLSACEILGMRVGEVRNTATSSEFKGESKEDSMRTFSSYFDCVIMRSPEQGLAERMAWALSHSERPIPIINAGSGKDQHPTQALLDIYTLQRSFERRGGVDGKTIVFVGDLARGRTVRSLAWLLTAYAGVRQRFVAPPALQIGDDILAQLENAGVTVEVSDDLTGALGDADAVYMTRIQDEWDASDGDSSALDTSAFCLTKAHMATLAPEAIVMHPLPRRKEIAPEIDADPRAMYWRQMRNGMWIRAALLASIFDCADEINDYTGT